MRENVPDIRVQRYRSLNWYVSEVDRPVILGDVGILIETESKKRFISLDFQGDKIVCIYLPICRDRLLIGTSLPNPPAINAKILNEAFSKKSREFFVSPISSPEHECLLGQIGKEADFLTQEEIENILDEIIVEYAKEQNQG